MNKLLQSERLVIESFLKQADAVLTMIGNIDDYGVARVVKAGTARDTSRDEYDDLLDALFHADDDFRSAKRALRRAVAKVEHALDVDADRKDEAANRRSQESCLLEMVERWEAEVQAAEEAEFMAKLEAYCKSTFESLSPDASDTPFNVTHLGQIRGTDRWQVPSVFKWL